MAAKARTLTKAAQTQIAKLLRRAFDGPPQFLAIDRVKKWFGRLDDDANKRLREVWKEQCTQNGSSGPTPKLLIGELGKPKGYILVRGDKKNEWLAAL